MFMFCWFLFVFSVFSFCFFFCLKIFSTFLSVLFLLLLLILNKMNQFRLWQTYVRCIQTFGIRLFLSFSVFSVGWMTFGRCASLSKLSEKVYSWLSFCRFHLKHSECVFGLFSFRVFLFFFFFLYCHCCYQLSLVLWHYGTTHHQKPLSFGYKEQTNNKCLVHISQIE